MKSKKWRKFTFSKYEFPTRILRNGTSGGELIVGSKKAFNQLIKVVGSDRVNAMRKQHRGKVWCWVEPRGAAKEVMI